MDLEQMALFNAATRWHLLVRRTGYADRWALTVTPIGGGGSTDYEDLTFRELCDVLGSAIHADAE